jgi:hypothetical protein
VSKAINTVLLLPLLTLVCAFAQDTILLGVAAENAVKESKLTEAGSAPFHLKARIIETTNPGF